MHHDTTSAGRRARMPRPPRPPRQWSLRRVARPLLLAIALVAALAQTVLVPLAPADAAALGRTGTVRVTQTASGGAVTYTVSWRAVRTATKYRVLVSSSPTMSSPTVITTRARRASFRRPVSSRSYCVRIRAVRGRKVGRPSATRCTSAQPGSPWVGTQSLQDTSAGTRAVIGLQWARTAGATGYEIHYAGSPTGAVVDISTSREHRVLRVAGTTAAVQGARVGGLTPGRVYCFQVRSLSPTGGSSRGGRHCKMAMKSSRAGSAGAVPLAVATFNTCSRACAPALGPWSARHAAALGVIRAMRAGDTGRPVDVLAVQEGLDATDPLTTSLSGTFTRACATSGRLQSLFVREDRWTIVDGTVGSLTFAGWDDPTHGACWVRLRDSTTGTEIVAAGVHLFNSHGTSSDAIRLAEIDTVADRIAAAHPGVPVVYAGDFNSNRSRDTDGPRLRLAQTGHDDAYDQAGSYGPAPYRSSACAGVCLKDRSVRTSLMWGDHVDRVFAPAGAQVVSWRLDHRMDGAKYAAPLLSDHHPVVVELRIPAASAG